MQDVLDEVRRLADRGFREVVLTGIHLGHYGVDFNRGRLKSDWVRLSRLVREICEQNPETRVRLSSIEATEVTRELIDVMCEFPQQVCPHLHVCLQSGSDSVLRRMRRRWSVKHIVDRCNEVKQRLDRPALTTDVIVGFPGETDSEFAETLSTCREIGFSKIHMFPFSARRGTPAADMPDQIAAEIKAVRGEQLAECESQLRQEYAESLIGSRLRVMLEEQDRERLTASGTSCRYVGTTVQFDNGPEIMPGKTGDVVDAIAFAFDGEKLRATPVV